MSFILVHFSEIFVTNAMMAKLFDYQIHLLDLIFVA